MTDWNDCVRQVKLMVVEMQQQHEKLLVDTRLKMNNMLPAKTTDLEPLLCLEDCLMVLVARDRMAVMEILSLLPDPFKF